MSIKTKTVRDIAYSPKAECRRPKADDPISASNKQRAWAVINFRLVQTSRTFHDLNLNWESGIMIVWKQRCGDYLNGCLILKGLQIRNNGFGWMIGKLDEISFVWAMLFWD